MKTYILETNALRQLSNTQNYSCQFYNTINITELYQTT